MSRGWHRDSARHSLAAKGVRTKNQKSKASSRVSNVRVKEKLGMLIDLMKADENILRSGITFDVYNEGEHNTELAIDFRLEKCDMSSTIWFDWGENKISGEIRLPAIDLEEYDELEEYVESLFDGMYGAEKSGLYREKPMIIDDEVVISEEVKPGKARPHIMLNIEKVSIKYFDEKILEILDKVNDILGSGFYE